MSYLLDALNKSRGEPSAAPTQYNEPAMVYAQSGFGHASGPNIYKWVSIVLALLLTLIVGIFVGNRYALFSPAPSAANTPVQPTTQVQPTPEYKSVENSVVKQQPEQQTKPSNSADVSALANAIPTTVKEPSTPTQSEIESEKPRVVGYIPKENTDNNDVVTDDSVSQDLLSRFNQAIKQSESTANSYQESEPTEYAVEEYLTRAPQLRELAREDQLKVPGFTYDTHLYATDPAERRVKLNGVTFSEKEWISDQVQIFEIQRQFLVFEMGHLRFSVPALTDWQDADKSAATFNP